MGRGGTPHRGIGESTSLLQALRARRYSWCRRQKSPEGGKTDRPALQVVRGRRVQSSERQGTWEEVYFSKIRITCKCFPSEPAQEVTSLTFRIDMVLHIPDGVQGFLKVWSASNFHLLPAPEKSSYRCLSEDLKLTGGQHCWLLLNPWNPSLFSGSAFCTLTLPHFTTTLAYSILILERHIDPESCHKADVKHPAITTHITPKELWSSVLCDRRDACSPLTAKNKPTGGGHWKLGNGSFWYSLCSVKEKKKKSKTQRLTTWAESFPRSPGHNLWPDEWSEFDFSALWSCFQIFC